MEIRKYREMLRHITRPKDKLSVNEKKKILDNHYKYEPWANDKVERIKKPMSMPRYISIMNRLYGSDGGAADPDKDPKYIDPDKDPKYIDPKEMEDIKKSLPVSEMVKKPKKKKTLIVEKPKPKPSYLNGNVIDIMPFLPDEEWWKILDYPLIPEEPKDEVLLRVPRRQLRGLAALLNIG